MVIVIHKGPKVVRAFVKLLKRWIERQRKNEDCKLNLQKFCWLFGVLESGFGTQENFAEVMRDSWLIAFFSGCPIWDYVQDNDELAFLTQIINSF